MYCVSILSPCLLCEVIGDEKTHFYKQKLYLKDVRLFYVHNWYNLSFSSVYGTDEWLFCAQMYHRQAKGRYQLPGKVQNVP